MIFKENETKHRKVERIIEVFYMYKYENIVNQNRDKWKEKLERKKMFKFNLKRINLFKRKCKRKRTNFQTVFSQN